MTKVIKTVCQNCGAVNEIVPGSLSSDENWLGCVLPTGFEWKLPSGKITPVVGDPIYVDAVGVQFSRAEYLAEYNIDPEIAYIKMRGKPIKPLHLGKE